MTSKLEIHYQATPSDGSAPYFFFCASEAGDFFDSEVFGALRTLAEACIVAHLMYGHTHEITLSDGAKKTADLI